MLRRKLSALASVPPHQVLADASAPSPVVLLACPPGERHDLVLLCVGRGADAQTVAEVGATALPDDPVRAVVFLVGALDELSGSW